MSEPFTTSDLPPGRSLSRPAQIRILAIAVIALVVVALLAGLLRLFGHGDARPAPALPPGTFRPTPQQMAELRIATVGTGVDPGDIVATGSIAVDGDHSTPVVLPYAGQVGEVYVQVGQHVAKGQPILKISSPDFVDARNALFSAAAQRNTAAAQLKTAQDNEARQAAIYQTAGGAQKDFKQSQTDLIAAQSAMRSADAALGAARDKLRLLGKTPEEIGRLEAAGETAGIYAQTTFHAPVAGVIAERNVAPGQYLSAGGDKPIVTISDLTRVWLVAQVDQTDAAKVHLGDPVDVTTPAYPGRVFHARIDSIGAELDPATHRLPVRATVANPDEALKPDMFARFSIARQGRRDAVVIPAAAVIHEGDAARVWVAGRDGLLRARTVVVSDSADGMVRVVSGVVPGERIVTSGAIFVNEAGIGE